VTNRDDVSADLLVIECLARHIDLYRFNSEDYPARIRLSANPLLPSEAFLADDAERVGIGEAGIWVWRPEWPTIDARVTDPMDAELARQESVAALGGVLRALGHRCVSPPDAMQAARWKISQLAVAQSTGMLVPETLLTSDPLEAMAFVGNSFPSVLKAVAEARVSIGADEWTGFVSRVSSDTDWASVTIAPVVLQREIVKRADLRVTVVGSELFPVLIRVPEAAPVDFRAVDPYDCLYETYNIDPKLADSCLGFLNQFGLKFGAFDFAIDMEGRAWFLECNPAGQWGWLEQFTGMHITAALADLLLSLR
jgi:hypothetical protein